MAKAIFVNLAVSDLKRAMRFFEAVGYSFDMRFTNDEAAALVISDTIFAMLHTSASLSRFTKKEIADPRRTTEVLLALQVDSKDAVNAMMDKVLAAGGKEAREPEDHGFMFGRSFEDPDGHIWEVFWMNPEAMPE